MGSLFFDTDVCLDCLLNREPFYQDAIAVLDLTRKAQLSIFISEGSVPNLMYIISERYRVADANERLTRWLQMCRVVSSGNQVIIKSLRANFKDLEDSYQYHTALHNSADCFITRNIKDYKPYATTIPVLTPTEFLEIYKQ